MQVAEASDPGVFDMMVYPDQHPGTHNYLLNQFASLSPTLMDSGRKFFQDSLQVVQSFCSGQMERAARLGAGVISSLLNPNRIKECKDITELQTASMLMQRYIMAHPVLRSKLASQSCYGYVDTYQDVEPGLSGWDQYDFRRVNNGMMQFDEEGSAESRQCFELLHDGDAELTLDQKVDIMNTHDAIQLFIDGGEDPTSPFGDKIG